MRAIPLFDYANLSSVSRDAFAAAIRPLKTLADVLSWARSTTPSWAVAEIVTQDEYTHDVVLEAAGQPYLAFDTT